MCVELEHAKFQQSSARETFSNWGSNGGVLEKCALSTENWPNLEKYSQGYY